MHVVYPPAFCITIVFDFPCDDCNSQEELIGNNGYAKFWGQNKIVIERFHSRGQHLCKCIGTKESVCIRKEFNSHRTGLEHQHGRRFIVLGHQYGRRDVMCKHSIVYVNKRALNNKVKTRFCPF